MRIAAELAGADASILDKVRARLASGAKREEDDRKRILIATQEVIGELNKLAKDHDVATKRGEEMGLTKR